MNLKNLLFSFRGRTGRLQFWVVSAVLMLTGGIASQVMGPYGPDHPMTLGPGVITLLLFIVTTWIALAVQVKRWHDRNKSGWWVLVNLVPVIGTLWALVECGFLPGTNGSNRFGE